MLGPSGIQALTRVAMNLGTRHSCAAAAAAGATPSSSLRARAVRICTNLCAVFRSISFVVPAYRYPNQQGASSCNSCSYFMRAWGGRESLPCLEMALARSGARVWSGGAGERTPRGETSEPPAKQGGPSWRRAALTLAWRRRRRRRLVVGRGARLRGRGSERGARAQARNAGFSPAFPPPRVTRPPLPAQNAAAAIHRRGSGVAGRG